MRHKGKLGAEVKRLFDHSINLSRSVDIQFNDERILCQWSPVLSFSFQHHLLLDVPKLGEITSL
jgi:hypothetical protein